MELRPCSEGMLPSEGISFPCSGLCPGKPHGRTQPSPGCRAGTGVREFLKDTRNLARQRRENEHSRQREQHVQKQGGLS